MKKKVKMICEFCGHRYKKSGTRKHWCPKCKERIGVDQTKMPLMRRLDWDISYLWGKCKCMYCKLTNTLKD